MYKIIFIDIDDTIRNTNKIITRRIKNAINKFKNTNILIILTTGRDRFHTTDVAKKINSSKYIIASNGADVYNYEDNFEI